MTTFGKLALIAAVCFMLADCARSITYPVTITATSGGVTHSIKIDVRVSQ